MKKLFASIREYFANRREIQIRKEIVLSSMAMGMEIKTIKEHVDFIMMRTDQ